MNEIAGSAVDGDRESAVSDSVGSTVDGNAASGVDGSTGAPATDPSAAVAGDDSDSDDRAGGPSEDPQANDGRSPAAPRDLPLDQTFELLRNQRRRYVLQYLEGKDEVSLSELAEQIAAWENDKEVREISSSERKRVYVGLYQCHLPKMDGMGVVAFNKPRGLIERGTHAAAVEPYLRRTRAPARRSLLGPDVGLAIAATTLLPLALLAVSRSTFVLGVAALVAIVATGWGVHGLRDERSPERGTNTDPPALSEPHV